MPLDPVKVDVAQRITARFLNMRQPSPRKPLAVLLRDGGILDEMENRSLIRAENNRTEYFPTFSTFAILNEDDAMYIKARDGVLKVLHTLTNLYEVDESSTQYTLEQLIERTRARYDSIDPDEISLGLYLVIGEFGAIQSYGRSPDGTQISSFTIAEQVLKIADPAAAWVQRAGIARNNASAPAATFEAIAKMKFDDAVSEIYEPAIEHNRGLMRQYQNAGIAEAGNFARQAADAVLKGFRQVEQIFRSTYLDRFAGVLDPLMEMQLRQIVEITLTEQTTRAQTVVRNLCMSFVTPISDRFTVIDAQVRDAGSRMKERLNNTITLNAAQRFTTGGLEDSSEEQSMYPDSSEKSNRPSVFISYAWESEELKLWVLDFARDLRSKGVNVTLDTDINNVIDTAETKGAKAAHDLLEQTQLIANTIPFSNKIPQLAGYSPHFVTPTSGTIHVDISGNFPFPFTDVFKPSLKIGGQSFDATSYGTNAIEFEFPTNVCGAAQTNTAVRSCSGTVSIPWDSTHGFHLRRSVSQGVFRVEFGLLPSNAGSFTITHKVESTRHDEVGKSSDVFTYDSSNNDIEENRPLHLTDQEIKDGWRIKPGSAHFVLVEHIEGVQGHDWYDMGYQNGNDVQVVWRARTERKHVGSSGKIRWRIDCTMMRNVPVTTDAKDILTANWSTSQVFEYPIGTWKLTWNTFDGKTLEYIDTDLSNVFMQLSARGTAFVVSTYKQQ